MDDKVFELINEKIDDLKSDLKGLELKVDEMLKFRWQVYGVTVVISAILGFGVQLFLAYIQRGG